jgi:hypothetical protein
LCNNKTLRMQKSFLNLVKNSDFESKNKKIRVLDGILDFFTILMI